MTGKIHSSTKVVLAVVAGAFLLANATECPFVRPFDLGAPATFGRVARYLFVRGWPLSPCMFATTANLSTLEVDVTAWAALVADAVLAVITLLLTGLLCEWMIWRWRGMRQLPVTGWGKLHLRTKVVFIAMTALFLWANSKEGPVPVNQSRPPQTDGFIGQALVGRGWPFSPWQFISRQGGGLRVEVGLFWWALATDAVVAFDAVLAATFVTEWLTRDEENGR